MWDWIVSWYEELYYEVYCYQGKDHYCSWS